MASSLPTTNGLNAALRKVEIKVRRLIWMIGFALVITTATFVVMTIVWLRLPPR